MLPGPQVLIALQALMQPIKAALSAVQEPPKKAQAEQIAALQVRSRGPGLRLSRHGRHASPGWGWDLLGCGHSESAAHQGLWSLVAIRSLSLQVKLLCVWEGRSEDHQ